MMRRHESEADMREFRRNGGCARRARHAPDRAARSRSRAPRWPSSPARSRISPQSVSERLKRLEDVGVLGFAVALDPEKLGLVDRRLHPHPAGDGRACPRRRDREDDPRDRRMPPHHRRGLLHRKGVRREVEDLERRDRPADPLRAHQHLDHPVVAGAGQRCRNMRERLPRRCTAIRCQALFM